MKSLTLFLVFRNSDFGRWLQTQTSCQRLFQKRCSVFSSWHYKHDPRTNKGSNGVHQLFTCPFNVFEIFFWFDSLPRVGVES